MKKLILLSILSLFTTSYIFAAEVTPKTGDNTVAVGTTFTHNIKVDDFINIPAFQLSMVFDPAVLKLNTVTPVNDIANGFSYNINNTQGWVVITWMNPSLAGVTIPNNGDLFKLSITAIGSNGSTSPIAFAFSPAPIEFLDINGNRLGSSKRNGTITLTGATPTITSTTPASICGPGAITLSATASSGVINWYSTPTGGLSLWTGTSFTTPILTPINTTTVVSYYVDATDNGLTSARVKVDATWIPDMKAPTVLCHDKNIDLNPPTSVTITINDVLNAVSDNCTAPNDIILQMSQSTFTIADIPNSPISISIKATDLSGNMNTCNSYITLRSSMPVVEITSTRPGSICGPGAITLSATASSGVINWYNTPTGGTSLGTGSSFITPIISTTTPYYVDVTDGGNTSTPRTQVDATVFPALIIGTPSVTKPSCNNGSDGKITVSATGGTGAITYSIAPNIGTQSPSGTFTGLTVQTYTFTATDANGCTTTMSATVGQTPPIVFTNSSVSNVLCNGGATGKVVVSATGGTGAITYSIAPNIGTQSPSGTFNGLTAGSYTFTATDNNGCSVATTAMVTEPPAGNMTSLLNTFATGVQNGTIVSANGGGNGGGNTSNSCGANFGLNCVGGGSISPFCNQLNCAMAAAVAGDATVLIQHLNWLKDRCDGLAPPPDNIAGPSVAAFYQLLSNVLANVSCSGNTLKIIPTHKSLTFDTHRSYELNIFPNPNDGLFTLALSAGATSNMAYRVTDLVGRIVLVKTIETGSVQQTVLTDGLPNGLYFLQVLDEGKKVAEKKFVKQ